MKAISIVLSILCLTFLVGCNAFQTAYFGVEDEAIHTPPDFGKTKRVIEKAKKHADSVYAEKEIDKAMELGKTASIMYWEGHDQEAINMLALARQAALNSEIVYAQPSPPSVPRVNSVPANPDPPETISAGEPFAESAAPAPKLKIEGTTEDRGTAPDTEKPETETQTVQKPEAETQTVQKPRTETKAPDLKQSQIQYAIQVAAFKQSAEAETLRETLAAKDYPAYRQKAEIDGEAWHRVRLGPYTDRETAQNEIQKLKTSGLAKEGFLVKEK